MKSSRELFWQQVIKERHELFMSLGMRTEGGDFETAEREYLRLQKDLIARARTEWARDHIQRLIAQDILNVASIHARNWKQFSRVLRRIEGLGYSDLDARVHTACLTLSWMSSNDQARAPLAWAMLGEAERRLRRVRKGHFLREEGLDSIDAVKKRMARKGLVPPSSPERSLRSGSRSRLRLLPPPPRA
jgi:hypothetical protein